MNRPPVDLPLPVGETPGWELQYDEDGKLKNISDSLVIYQSLRQSRERWLSSAFSKFSSKNRGGKGSNNPVPPPHSLQARGKCDLEIGPHIFPETIFYEVNYLTPQSQPVYNSVYPYQPLGTSSWQSTTPYSASYVPFGQHATATPPLPAYPPLSSTERTTTTPLLSSLTAVTTITPTLINQVNSAASTDPILANLLQLAAAGRATPEQLKTLGLLIQSLATSDKPPLGSHSSAATLQNPSNVTTPTTSVSDSSALRTLVPPAVKEFDIIIEFRESLGERWIYPRGPAICERLIDDQSADAAHDVVVTTCLPIRRLASATTDGAAEQHGNSDGPMQVVTFRLKKAPLSVWHTLSKWVGDEEKMAESRKFLENLKQKERLFLGHRMAEGSLFSQLQAAAASPFVMKSLKSGTLNAPRTKRKYTQRKPDRLVQPKKLATEKRSTEVSLPAVKRRRASQAKANPTVSRIQCFSCQQGDVPLILGGRYCRPCVEAGRATDVPQVHMPSYISRDRNMVAAQPPGHEAKVQQGGSDVPIISHHPRESTFLVSSLPNT